MLKPYLALFYFMLLFLNGQAQQVWMHPNAGQWDERIEYKIDIVLGEMYIERDGVTYFMSDIAEKSHGHDHSDGHHDHSADEIVRYHVIQSKFIGINDTIQTISSNPSDFYRNYMLGNDQNKWKSHLNSFSRIEKQNIYNGVDLIYASSDDELNYSFSIDPLADVSMVKRLFVGHEKLEVDEDGNLVISHRFGKIKESKPIAWNVIDGRKVDVPIEFKIEEGVVSFNFPEGYMKEYELFIDPSITFSTYSGATSDNWGLSATPDVSGNLIGGGVSFAPGYPIVPGAYDATFNGGTVDLAITKFNADGTNLIYSTYIGGVGSETPNSMICAPNGELFIFGVTSSVNFPMAGTPYDPVFSGGPNVSASVNGLGFQDGSDLFIARLSADGSTLLASTYIGGSSTDGLNISNLQYNYGDQFRGEIILDEAGDVYVTSSTQSNNFPIVLGAQAAIGGGQDAVAFKMPPTLNTLYWSTYLGGNGNEAGNSIQISSAGNAYVVGGTTSANLNLPLGEDLTYNGGLSDGFVIQLNGANGSMISGSYMGFNEYDQAYCVQLDIDDNVYVLGQSQSNWPITPGHYGVPNSGQFIRKYNSNLTTIEWTTMVGAGTGNVEISPTAFLVSDCYDIYYSGWGGQLNVNAGNALFSSSNGFPVTPDAYQSATNGNNFYISVLGADAMSLKYGTFMGGTTGPYNHVDGGTSRFDKAGRIYHAVCAACGGNPNGFTSTPGVWSTTNNSSNCNLAAFKFELSTIDAVVTEPTATVCIPDPVIFDNNSANGNDFFWNFGDGNTSTDVNPTHLYASPGVYNVVLVVSDTNGCFTPDSVQFEVTIGDFQGGVIQPTAPICPGDSFQFEAYGGSVYAWSPAQFLDDSTSATPTATVNVTTDFMVIISDTCGLDTVYVTLPVFLGASNISSDTSICIGNSVVLNAEGGVSYEWTPPTYLDDPSSSTPISTPDATITYNVEIITSNGCILNEEVLISVYYDPPVPVIEDTLIMCSGSSVEIVASGAETYFWYPNNFLSQNTGSVITANPPTSQWYYCDFENPCGVEVDSVFIEVILPEVTAGNDTIVCPGESAILWAAGGVEYQWYPQHYVSHVTYDTVLVSPTGPIIYTVVGTDEFGCIDSDSVFVDFYPLPSVVANPDVYAFYGDEVQLSASSNPSGTLFWSPADFLTCEYCSNPVANPNQTLTYTVTVTDVNGCQSSDDVTIHYDPIIYVPNTFTPDEDEFNQSFLAVGGNIESFQMLIFDRWGEVIFESNNMQFGWDGTYNGQKCQDGTYIWKILIADLEGKKKEYVGHVNLIR